GSGQLPEGLAPQAASLSVGGAQGGTGCVEQQAAAGFGIFHLQEADRGQAFLAWIGNAHGREVVPASRAAKGSLVALVKKVTQEKDDGPAALHPVEKVEGLLDRGAPMLRLKEQNVAYEP